MKKSLPILAVFISFFGITACEHTPIKTQNLDGIWSSIGYGKVIQIKENRYELFDLTKRSCIPKEQGTLSSFGGDLSIRADTLILLKGTSTYFHTRLQSMPDLCQAVLSETQKQDPVYNYSVFESTIAEHFAYFKENKINWDSLRQAYKNQVSSATKAPALYLIMDEMLSALNDNHGYLEPSDSIYDLAMKLQAETNPPQLELPLKEYGDLTIAQMVAAHYLDEDLTKDSPFISWGKIKGNIGYIQVKTMWLYADLGLSDSLIQEHGFVGAYVEVLNNMNETEYIKKEVAGVRSILDKVINDLLDTEYIILDIRFNGGGQDAVSREILRHFNAAPIQIASKKAVHKESYTPQTALYMEGSEPAYLKPVFLLTSQQSASAADFMTLASLELPSFKRIGAHTNGALSDALEKTLPNGWYFSISNEIYTDLKGVCYESIGIPPDIEIAYPSDRQTFFHLVADDLEGDKAKVFQAIEKSGLIK